MINRNSRALFLVICILVSHSRINGRKTAEGNGKSQQLKSREGKFVDFEFISPSSTYTVDTGAAYLPPSRKSPSSPFKNLPSAYVIDFKKPSVLEELDEIKASGMKSISHGLKDVASYVGGNIGYFLGAKSGFHISTFAGRLRGVAGGADTGSVIGANVASAPFNAITRQGFTDRDRNRHREPHGSSLYAQDINSRRRPTHHNRRLNG